MRITTIIATLCVLGALLPLGAASKEQKGFADGLPTPPNSSLLIGLSPFILEVANPREVVRLQPEYEQPETRDATALYPSISRDGKTIAYARVKDNRPGRILAISTYSVTTNKHTEYATGEYSGSTAISPDASRLAYADARTMGGVPRGAGDYHMHIVDLRTGQQTLGPAISDSSGRCLPVGPRIRANWLSVSRARSESGTLTQAMSGKLQRVIFRHGLPWRVDCIFAWGR